MTHFFQIDQKYYTWMSKPTGQGFNNASQNNQILHTTKHIISTFSHPAIVFCHNLLCWLSKFSDNFFYFTLVSSSTPSNCKTKPHMRLKRRQIYASHANRKLKEQVNQIKILYFFIECILNVICSSAVCLFQELFGGKYEGRKLNLIQRFKLWIESVLKFCSNLLFVTLVLWGDTQPSTEFRN